MPHEACKRCPCSGFGDGSRENVSIALMLVSALGRRESLLLFLLFPVLGFFFLACTLLLGSLQSFGLCFPPVLLFGGAAQSFCAFPVRALLGFRLRLLPAAFLPRALCLASAFVRCSSASCRAFVSSIIRRSSGDTHVSFNASAIVRQ